MMWPDPSRVMLEKTTSKFKTSWPKPACLRTVRDDKAQILVKLTKVYKAQSYKAQILSKDYKAQNTKGLQDPNFPK